MRAGKGKPSSAAWWIGPALLGWLMVTGALVAAAGNTYLVDPMASELSLSSGEIADLQTVKALAALAVVFSAGQSPSWLGYRRSVLLVSACFTLAGLTTAVAFDVAVLRVGYTLLGAATGAMIVIAVSLINSSVVEKKQRASAFAVLGAVAPAVFLIFPVVTGYVVDSGLWRLVPLSWSVFGTAIVLCVRWAPAHVVAGDSERPELATGVLAGLTLALGLGALGSMDWSDPGALKTVAQGTGAVIAGTLLLLAYRRSQRPGLSLAPLRNPEMRLLLAVGMLVAITSTYFWITMGFQYVYNLSMTAGAVVMLPMQAMGVVGALVLARYVMSRYPVYVAGLVALGMQGLAQCLLFFIQPGQPVWVPGVLVAAFGLLNGSFVAIIASVIMSSASPADSGSMSAFKSAAGSVGGLFGTIFVSALTLMVIQIRLFLGLTTSGADQLDAKEVVTSLVSSPSRYDQIGVYAEYSSVYPLEELHEEALIAGFRANTVVGLIGTMGAALIIGHLMRRERRQAVPS